MPTSKSPKERKPPLTPETCPPLVVSGFTPIVEVTKDGSLARGLTERNLVFPWQECLRHIMIVGKTGAGKTTRCVLRLAFAAVRNKEQSLVIIDAQRTEEERLIKYARKIRGPKTRIVRINMLDPEFSTHYWNPLDGVVTKADAYDVASTIAQSTDRHSTGDGEFFRDQATLLLSGIFRGLQKTNDATLAAARKVIDGGSRAIRELADKADVEDLTHFADEIAGGNRNTETVLSEASNFLIALYDENVATCTSRSELDFALLEQEPTLLILSLDEESVARMRPLTNVFLHRLFGWIVKAGRKSGGALKRPIGIFIDEFASAVGRLPNFERRAHTLRKRNAAIIAAVQSTEQIAVEYGHKANAVLAAFNHRILVPPLSTVDGDFAAQASGIITVDQITTSPNGSALSMSPGHRTLLLPAEVSHPRPDPKLGPRITFLLADTPPFQGFLKAAWETPEEKDFVQATGVLPITSRLQPPPQPQPVVRRVRKKAETQANIEAKEKLKETEYANLLLRSGLSKIGPLARRWWSEVETKHRHEPEVVYKLLEGIIARGITIHRLWETTLDSGTRDPEANLHYFDYLSLLANKPNEGTANDSPPSAEASISSFFKDIEAAEAENERQAKEAGKGDDDDRDDEDDDDLQTLASEGMDKSWEEFLKSLEEEE